MKQDVIKTINSVLLIVIITILLGEITLRIYNYFNPLFVFYDDSYNRFRGKPFANDWGFRLNSQGFKDTEFSQKNDQTYRILGIGDSFAYGVVPYQYNYLTLLESKFQKEGLSVEVLNMGIPSTGPPDYLSLLIHEGLQLQPDMVLLSFFIGNDITDCEKERKWYSYSHLASLFHYILTIRPQYEGQIVHKKKVYCDQCPFLDQDTYLKLEKGRGLICVKNNTAILPLFDEAFAYLKQIKNICAKKGIELVVVIIPDEVQINTSLQKQVRQELFIQDSIWSTTLPNERLMTKFNEMGIHFIDLYPYFAKEAPSQNLYRSRDTHWNIAGNRLAANIIYSHIKHTIRPDKLMKNPARNP